MNITPSYGATSFGSAYINPKGAEKFCKEWSPKIVNRLADTAERAKGSMANHIILDSEGIIHLQNAKYGGFVTNNPPRPEVSGNVFSCDIKDDFGKIRRFQLDMPDESSAKKLEKSFGAGTTIPEGRLDLYDAMEASTAHNEKKAALQRLLNLNW